jgi:endonuclease/exonuclease/phosphatase family metal-dependent hydrolase
MINFMIHIILLLILPFSLLIQADNYDSEMSHDDLRVLSFNIRFDNPSDGPNAWDNRKEKAASVIRLHDADLVGLQEALLHQIQDLQDELDGYGRIGVGRDDGETGGEFTAILYRKEKVKPIKSGTFWLSETPSVPGSISWDAAITRICTWAEFEQAQTGEIFYLFNTHYDHIGEEARLESSKLILNKIEEIAGESPVVLTGDFNATEDSQPYRVLVENSEGESGVNLQDAFYKTIHEHHGPTSTWSGFTEIVPDRRIDYIFVNTDVTVKQHAILADQWDGRFPSDHLPVLAEITID